MDIEMEKYQCRICEKDILLSTKTKNDGLCTLCYKITFDLTKIISFKNEAKNFQHIAIKYILMHSIDVESWKYTLIGKLHKALLGNNFHTNELPIVCCYISNEFWFIFSNQRIFGKYNGELQESMVNQFDYYVGNFKDSKGFSDLILKKDNKVICKFRYETGNPSMSVIYYFKFWNQIYPIISKYFQ